MPDVTLITGEVVDSTAPAWRQECLTRQRHVETLRRLQLEQRREYLRTVEAKEGGEARRRLEEAYLKDWEARRADR